ncbi:MAG: asparagine synthase (glutamine-hydrolyzing) [Ferruginibacter sp.]
MCGIAGILSQDNSEVQVSRLEKMAAVLAHRGPDGEGIWVNKNGTTGFAHRRLSILDLSNAGAQPMHYLERYSIVYNGEIYNYLEIKSELQKAGYSFKSKTDTEVILAAFDSYRERCLQFLDGMFAFAIWDEEKKELFAARDRFGEKPFFYVKEKKVFAFASEMKALWAAGITPKSIEPKMLLNYLALGQVKNADDKSQTFFSNIYSLPGGHFLTFSLAENTLDIQSWWDIDKQAKINISPEKAAETLDKLFEESIKIRLRSDVTVGCSLSGGLDSSSIAWYVNQIKGINPAQPFKTFSAVFPGFKNDEGPHVENVTQHLGLQNYTCKPAAGDLITQFENLLWHQEEPFPSSSIYAQYKVFELAASHKVPVLLDGQGADEILAGYHKYIHWFLQELVSRNRFSRLKSERKHLLDNDVALRWNFKNIAAAFLPSHAAIALEKKEFNIIKYNHDISKEMLVFLKGREWDGIHKPVVTKLNDMLYFNVMQNGLEELLRFADRNSMAHGCEVRLPFLSPALVKFIFSLPSHFKINEGYPKWIWRKMMDKRLPDSIVWRKDKVGFEPPQQSWMEDVHMQEFIYEARRKLVREGILKKQVLTKTITAAGAHDPNNADWRYICAAYM